ncbi:hypothetical protein Tco_1156541 [Tanacetum coccineum]
MAETRINRGTKEKEVLRFSFESLILSEEDWDTIRAKLEANSGIKRVCFGKDLFSTKESLKRFGEELQTKTAKKLKFDDESYSTNRGEDKGQWKKIILLQNVMENGTNKVYISFGSNAELTVIKRDPTEL